MIMSLDSVLIISFTGIFVGIILLLFSNDKEINNNFFTIKTKSRKIFYSLEQTYKKRLEKSIDVNTYDLRFYAQIIDLIFIGMLVIVIKYYSDEINMLLIVSISIVLFFLPIILWRQSLGQKFMHLKVYNWDNEPIKDFDIIFLRYLLKYLLCPISLITFLKNKFLFHDILFKTYEKQE